MFHQQQSLPRTARRNQNKDEFNALQYSLANEYQPNSPTEHILLINMSESHWLAQRAQGLLTGCLDSQTGKITDPKSFSLYHLSAAREQQPRICNPSARIRT